MFSLMDKVSLSGPIICVVGYKKQVFLSYFLSALLNLFFLACYNLFPRDLGIVKFKK